MKLDLICLGLMGFFGVLGLVHGAAQQLAHMGGVLLGYLLCHTLGELLGPWVAEKLGFPIIAGVIGVSVLGFFAVYTLSYLLIQVVVKRILGDQARGAADRVGGFALGVAKTGVIVFVIVSGMVLVEKAVTNAGFKFLFDTRHSQIATLARQHNALTLMGFPGVDGLERLAKVAKNPEEAKKLLNDPKMGTLMKDPRIQQIMHDDSLTRALESGDVSSLLNNNKILDALSDPRVFEKLQKVQ